MTGGPDWDQTRATITAYLDTDEPIENLFTALVPPPDSDDGRGIAPAALWPVIMAASELMWQAAVRKASRAARVPLTRRMIIALTPRRLAIWQASRGWRLGAHRGDLPRDTISRIDVSGTGSRSRLLTLHLSAGASVTLRVAPAVADRIRDLIPG